MVTLGDVGIPTAVSMMSQPMSVLTSHKSAEWYTPPHIVALVREVLGEIDLDPASAKKPQRWIMAGRYWSKRGLERPWLARTVFCNPPYGKVDGRSCQAVWSFKMANEYEDGHFEQGILLINSTHGYKWYEEIWGRYTCCLARERIRFIRPDGTTGGQAKRGQTFVYFGEREKKFADTFSRIGRILRPR